MRSFLLVLVLLTGCSRWKTTAGHHLDINIESYSEDISRALANHSTITLPSLTEMYVLKSAKTKGLAGLIFPEEVTTENVVFHSSDKSVIQEFLNLLGERPWAFYGNERGLTYQVVLRIGGSKEAASLRVFVPEGDESAGFVVGGTSPKVSKRNPEAVDWILKHRAVTTPARQPL